MQLYQRSLKYSNEMIRSRLKGRRLLDIGGAECPQRVNYFSDFVAESFLLDCQEPFPGLKPAVKFLRLPIEELSPSVAGMFDEIIMSNVLEHLDDPAFALKRVRSVLADGGSVHILSPNCESLNRRIGVEMGILKDIREIPQKEVLIGHKHALSVRDVLNMASGAGFDILETVGVLLKPIPTPEMLAWDQKQLEAFFSIAPKMPPELCHEVYFRMGG